MRKSDKPPRPIPETEEGQAAFDRFRELARQLVNVSREKAHEPQVAPKAPS